MIGHCERDGRGLRVIVLTWRHQLFRLWTASGLYFQAGTGLTFSLAGCCWRAFL